MATPAPTDDELNAWIIARLNLIGVDLSVLPVSDSSAPADQTRILSSVRNLLRGSVPTISAYVADVQENPPVLYPAELSAWTDE
ncbi:MAG: hypothetical protein AB1689_11075 [Thermodesulfobacteriota bacterium]